MTEPQNQSQYHVTQMSEGFGWAAPMPEATAHEMAPARPATLTAASWVWLAAAVLGVISLPLLILVNSDPIATGMIEDRSGDPLTMAEAKLTVNFLALLAAFGTGVVSIPFVIAAIKLRSGKHWARVLLAILSGVVLIYNLSLFAAALTADSWQVGVALTIATVGLTIAGLVLVFLPPSNAFVAVAGYR